MLRSKLVKLRSKFTTIDYIKQYLLITLPLCLDATDWLICILGMLTVCLYYGYEYNLGYVLHGLCSAWVCCFIFCVCDN